MTPERIAVAALAALLASAAGLPRAPRLTRVATAASTLALALLLGLRWWRIGHGPVFGTFETSLAATLVLCASAPPLARRAGAAHARVAAGLAAVTLAHALTLRSEPTPVTISEQSLWIDLHAALAWIAWAAYLHGAALAFREGAAQALAVRALGLGFVAHGALGAVGAYYASILFATPWQWDPVQILGLLAWILIGVALHFRLFHGVSPRRQRWFIALGVAVFVLGAKAMPYLPAGQTFHVFELGAMAPEPGGNP
ncbi:MAG: cytochrome c biogenesis protein CcsA [Myxococcota bacterium]